MAEHDASEGVPKSPTAPALKGVRRALEVLEHLAVNPGRASEISQQLGVSWATLHRTLSQLEQGGFLMRDPDTNRYSIGPRMWFVGTSYLAHHPVIEVAQPHIDAAAQVGAYTAQLVERSDRLAVTLYSYHTTGEIITKSTYGYHFPLHCGSKGQVLLAFAGDSYIEEYLSGPLESLTRETDTDPESLRGRLALAREQGYCRTMGDVQAFTGSVAAPVFDRSGQAVAAVCFITRRTAFRDEARVDEMIERLLSTVHNISIGLGWRP